MRFKIKSFKNFSLRNKFFLITVTCATSALLISNILSIVINYRDNLRDAEQGLGVTANTMEAMIAYNLYNQKNTLVLAAENLSKVDSSRLLSQIAEAFQKLEYQSLVLLDEEGRKIWGEGFLKSVSFDPKQLSRLRENDLVDGFNRKRKIIYYYQAVKFRNADATYLLVGSINGNAYNYTETKPSALNLISSYIKDFKYKDNGFACIVGWTDSLELLPLYAFEPLIKRSDVLKQIAGASFETVESFSTKSTSYYFYKKQIRRTPWYLIIFFPRSEMFSAMYRSLAGQALTFLILSMVIWLIVAQVVEHITRPIEKMAQSMSVIAHGNYDVEFSPLSQEDEIGVVSRSFFSLIEAVRDYSEKLRQLSITDPLTGLFNQREFRSRFEKEWERSVRYGNNLSFLMIDIDFFKKFNDDFGHQKGDEALRLVAGILRDNIRASDSAFRYGGEEFSVILPQTNLESAGSTGEKLRTVVDSLDPFVSERGETRKITVSIGVSSFPECTNLKEELIKLADEALYQAKKKGRNRVEFAPSKAALIKLEA